MFINFIFSQEIKVSKFNINQIDGYLKSKNYSKTFIKDLKNKLEERYYSDVTLDVIDSSKIIVCEISLVYGKKIKAFKSEKNRLKEFNTIPISDEFYNNLNSLLKTTNKKIEGKIVQSEIVGKKEGSYLLSSKITIGYSEQIDKNSFSYTEAPFTLEYETKDFVNYFPIRYRGDREIEWIEIK